MKEGVAFAKQAERFCGFIEGAAALELLERVKTARARVLELYLAGLALSAMDAEEEVGPGPSPAPPSDWPGFDRFEFYFETLEIFDVESRVGAGDLSDDLLDIYRDVKRGLELWSGGHRATAVWHWRLLLQSHWGTHAVGALRALHHACAELEPLH